MIVYRFEKNGLGPYINNSNVVIGAFYKDNNTRTGKKYAVISKKYTVDSKAYWRAHNSKRYMYGCSSKEQLRAYFNGNFKDLFKEGFRIKRYKVPDELVIDIGNQVAFPVQYHKLQSVNGVNRKKKSPRLN